MNSMNPENNQNNQNDQIGQNDQGYQNPYADPSSAQQSPYMGSPAAQQGSYAIPSSAQPDTQPNFQSFDQNPYYIDPASAPSGITVKKSKKKIWIPIVSVLLAAGAAAAVFFFIVQKNKPSAREAVTKAILNPFTSSSPSLESRYLGQPALKENSQKSPYQADIELHITELSGSYLPEQLSMFDDLHLVLSSARDLEALRCAGMFSLEALGISLDDVHFYFYDDKCAIASPDLLDGYVEARTTELGKDFNNSALAGMLGQQIDPSLSFNMFDLLKNSSQGGQSQSSDTFDKLLDLLEYTESSKKATITVGGKKQSCKCYKVSLPAERMQDMFSSLTALSGNLPAIGSADVTPDALAPYLPDEDIVFYVYTTKNGKLARLEIDQSIALADLSVDINGAIDFTGKDAPGDEIDGSVNVTVKGVPCTVRISSSKNESSTSRSRNTTLTLSAAGLPLGSLKAVSEFDTTTGRKHSEINVTSMNQTIASYETNMLYKDVVPGERYTLEIQNVSLDAMGMITLEMNGSCACAPCGPIATPAGIKYDLFSMTKEDLQEMLMKVAFKLLGNGYFG